MSSFCGKCLKFNIDLKNTNIKIEIIFLVSEIISSELVALNCVYHEGNTCHWQSMH